MIRWVILCLTVFASTLDGQDSLDWIRLKVDSIELVAHPLQEYFFHRGNELIITPSGAGLAASFSDPARTLIRFPGVSNDNDQANGVVLRGWPPSLNKWSVYGAEIVNPNHLSNAGQFSDKSSINSGGVLGIPFEVVKEFIFTAHPLPASKVNAISSNMDFRFAFESGNFIRAGLLGLEASYKGPEENSLGIHARYSFVGLLSDLGVSFDGERIRFTDLFLEKKLNKHTQLFASLGYSSNHKDILGPSDRSKLKDFQKIDYEASFVISGLHYETDKWNQVFVLSYRRDQRKALTDPALSLDPNPLDSTFLGNAILAYNVSYKWGDNLSQGIWALDFNNRWVVDKLAIIQKKITASTFITGPVIKFKKQFSGSLPFIFNTTMRVLYDSRADQFLAEPWVSVQIAKGQWLLGLESGLNSQRQNPYVILKEDVNSNLLRNRSISSALTSKFIDNESKISIMARLFGIYLFDLPVSMLNSPVANEMEYLLISDSSSYNNEIIGSSARSFGIELLINKDFTRKFSTTLSASFFDAKFEAEDGQWYDTRYNFGHCSNLMFSFYIFKEEEKSFFVNLSFHYRGGAYNVSSPVHILAESRLDDYARIDLRGQYDWGKNQIILDIQNLTNTGNDAYIYYDAYLHSEILQKQLGLIPVLSYKRFL